MNELHSSNIKLIAFDLFGVIFSEGHLISNVLLKLLPLGCKTSLVKSLYEDFNIGNISEAEFWQPLGFTDYKKIRLKFLQSFKLDKDLQCVVNKLSFDFKLSILSNLPPDWADTLGEQHQFQQFFAPQIFSGHVKCKKPQPAIYRKLLAKSGVNAEQIVFIDDRLENLQAAHEQGFITVYFHREKETLKFRADYKIDRLAELPELEILSA